MLLGSDAIKIGAIILVVIELIMVIKKVPLFRNALYAALIIYITLLCSVTLFPVIFQKEALEVCFDYEHNFVPFRSVAAAWEEGGREGFKNIFGNLLLVLPMGVLFPMLSGKKKFWSSFLAVFGLAVGIELAQYLIGLIIGYQYRMVDIDDVILNTVGGLIGYGVYRLLPQKLVQPFLPAKKKE